MTEEKKYTETEAHRLFAVNCFNRIWTLLGKKNRTEADKRLMEHLAHTSLYHWLQIGKPINEQRGEWMLARVYTILENKSKALQHAERCMKLTKEQDLKDFDLAYAYEALARAYALIGNEKEHKTFFKLAEKAAMQIAEKEDHEIFVSDLNSEPWFGIKG